MGIPFPEEYGGAAATRSSYALVVEELARVDSSVAITLCAHTSFGTQPIYLFGSEDQKQEWLPQLCAGDRLAAFGLTEPEAGSDAGQHPHPRGARRRRVGDQRVQAVHHERRHRHLGRGGDHCRHGRWNGREDGRREISNILVPNGTPGYEPGEPYRKIGLERVGHPTADVHRLPGARREPGRATRRRAATVPAGARHRPHRGRRDGRRPGAGRARPGARLRPRAPRVRSADLQVPDDPGQARRPLGRDRGRPGCSSTRRPTSRTPTATSR